MSKRSIITQKDILILQKLFEDGRKSSASISKDIDLGREIVNYRIKRLIKENLIVKFVPKINDKALHYQEYIIFLKLNLDDELSKEKFIRDTIGNKYLIWVIKSENGWDLMVRLYTENFEEFKVKLEEILELFSEVLANYYTIISSDEIKQSEKELISKEIFHTSLKIEDKDFSTIKEGNLLQIDDKDKEIINLLEQDARIQYKEISEKLNISSDTVKYRIEKMRSQGIIENFSPILNFNKLGLLQYAAIIKCSFLTKNEETEICNYLNSNPSIIRAIKNLNRDEFFLNLVFNKEKELNEMKRYIFPKFNNKILQIDIFKID